MNNLIGMQDELLEHIIACSRNLSAPYVCVAVRRATVNVSNDY